MPHHRHILNGSRCNFLCHVYTVWGGDVFHSSRGLSKLDMHRLSVKLHLASRERSFDELHFSRGSTGDSNGDLDSSVRTRTVPDTSNRIGGDDV
jgi:hypothetical protein